MNLLYDCPKLCAIFAFSQLLFNFNIFQRFSLASPKFLIYYLIDFLLIPHSLQDFWFRVQKFTAPINSGLCEALWISGYNSLSSFKKSENDDILDNVIRSVEHTIRRLDPDSDVYARIEKEMYLKIQINFRLPCAYKSSLKFLCEILSDVSVEDFNAVPTQDPPIRSHIKAPTAKMNLRVTEKAPEEGILIPTKDRSLNCSFLSLNNTSMVKRDRAPSFC